MNLADRYSTLKFQIEALEQELSGVKSEIKALGQEQIEGDSVYVTLSLSERNSLDTAAVKKFLTEAQIKDCTKTSLVETIRIKPKVKMAA
jgi:hypothetical protein